jgi:hypothetical protein
MFSFRIHLLLLPLSARETQTRTRFPLTKMNHSLLKVFVLKLVFERKKIVHSPEGGNGARLPELLSAFFSKQ